MISEPGLASVLGSPFDALSSSSSQAPASESAASESKQSTPASDESLDDGVELLIETQRSAKLPKDNGLFLDATNSAFVDKTSFFRSLPDRFEYFLLRPPRFGKTAFISTLQAFYDINGAAQFSDRFGSLAVGHKTPSTLQHSHHLCMTFPFDILGSHLSFKLIADLLPIVISAGCINFLAAYATQLPRAEDLDYEGDLLSQVLDLVHRHGHSMIVSVDDFDAPFRPKAPGFCRMLGPPADPQEITELFNSKFWAPIRAAPHVIHKLMVMGTILPINLNLPPSAPPTLGRCCGFSDEETQDLAVKALGEPVDIDELRRSCGGYSFPTENGEEVFLHPQLVLDWIRDQKNDRSNDRSIHCSPPFELLADLVSGLPMTHDDPSRLSVDGLLGLIAAGKVKIDDMNAFHHHPREITWAAIYQAGGLTRDAESGHFRIPNGHILSIIRPRVDDLLTQRYDLPWQLRDIWGDRYALGTSHRLVALLSRVLRYAMRSTLFYQPEPNLRGIFELVFRHTQVISEYTPPSFILAHNMDDRICVPDFIDELVPFELVTLSLRGMWHGQNVNMDHSPTKGELQDLFDQLRGLDEETLWTRPYRTSPSDGLDPPVPVSVESFLNTELDIPQLIAVGGARVLLWPREYGEVEEQAEIVYVDKEYW